MVYGTGIVFHASLGFRFMKFLQEQVEEINPIQRRINPLIKFQQMREYVYNKSHLFKEKVIFIFYKATKADDFQIHDLVLKWDARNEEKGKDGKFDNL